MGKISAARTNTENTTRLLLWTLILNVCHTPDAAASSASMGSVNSDNKRMKYYLPLLPFSRIEHIGLERYGSCQRSAGKGESHDLSWGSVTVVDIHTFTNCAVHLPSQTLSFKTQKYSESWKLLL